jgi:hypothetical protein
VDPRKATIIDESGERPLVKIQRASAKFLTAGVEQQPSRVPNSRQTPTARRLARHSKDGKSLRILVFVSTADGVPRALVMVKALWGVQYAMVWRIAICSESLVPVSGECGAA